MHVRATLSAPTQGVEKERWGERDGRGAGHVAVINTTMPLMARLKADVDAATAVGSSKV